MKIKLLTLILLTMTQITGFGQNKTTVSKIYLIVKIYSTKVYEMHGKIVGGGFNEDLYCDLQFEKDSVKVTHRTLRETSMYGKTEKLEKTENKTYKWKIRKNAIIIEKFTKYGQFTFTNGQFVADKDFHNNPAGLIFTRLDANKNN